jgi:hypothetical protein
VCTYRQRAHLLRLITVHIEIQVVKDKMEPWRSQNFFYEAADYCLMKFVNLEPVIETFISMVQCLPQQLCDCLRSQAPACSSTLSSPYPGRIRAAFARSASAPDSWGSGSGCAAPPRHCCCTRHLSFPRDLRTGECHILTVSEEGQCCESASC